MQLFAREATPGEDWRRIGLELYHMMLVDKEVRASPGPGLLDRVEHLPRLQDGLLAIALLTERCSEGVVIRALRQVRASAERMHPAAVLSLQLAHPLYTTALPAGPTPLPGREDQRGAVTSRERCAEDDCDGQKDVSRYARAG